MYSRGGFQPYGITDFTHRRGVALISYLCFHIFQNLLLFIGQFAHILTPYHCIQMDGIYQVYGRKKSYPASCSISVLCSPSLYHGVRTKSNLCSQFFVKSVDKEYVFGYYKGAKRKNVREEMGRGHGKKNTEKSSKKIQKNQKKHIRTDDNGFDPVPGNPCNGRRKRRSDKNLL